MTKRCRLSDGRVIGGIPFSRGPLAYLLRNRFYLGEVVYRGNVSQGEHPTILEPEPFAAVQERLARQHHGFVRARAGSQALLLRRLVDYPNLWAYTRELYQWPGVADTVDFAHIKGHYYASHATINPTGIVPKGPLLDFTRAHGRDALRAVA